MILSAFCFSILLLQRPFDYIVRQNSKRLAIFQKFFKIFNKKAHCIRNKLSGTRNGNRTHNYPLGGGYYIHLTMQAFWKFVLVMRKLKKSLFYSFFCKRFVVSLILSGSAFISADATIANEYCIIFLPKNQGLFEISGCCSNGIDDRRRQGAD